MKPRNRECEKCNIPLITCSRSNICIKCVAKEKELAKIEEEKLKLLDLGYVIKSGPEYNAHHKRVYHLITPCCGSNYSPTFGNIRKQINLLGKAPCQKCGGKDRASKGLAKYVEKYGVTYDEKSFDSYQKNVRKITEATYRNFKDTINPLGFVRGHGKYHLDHKVPIMWCFKNEIDPMLVGSISNLQMLYSVENIKKSDKHFNKDEALAILEKTSYKDILLKDLNLDDSNLFDVVPTYANVWSATRTIVREQEFLENKEAVLSRLRYLHDQIKIKIGARSLTLVEVNKPEAKEFFNKWHIQGSAPSKICYGLRDSDKLVSVMSFGSPRSKQKDADWELIRFCSDGNIIVNGAASKLLKHFIKLVHPKCLVSYSLNRWGDGSVYKSLGFEKIVSNQALFYLWSDGKLRPTRASIIKASKDKIDLKTLRTIKDAGSTTWRLYDAEYRKNKALINP
jgi:hypothetical protein